MALELPRDVEIIWRDDTTNGQVNADYDVVLGTQVAHGERPPTIRIWRSATKLGIGVSRKDIAGPMGANAKQVLEEQGLDVVVRQTGGTAVPQGPGVIHLSYLFPRSAHGTTDDYYRILCNPFIEWLATHGVLAKTGALPGSYCDGTYNVLVGERKLIGTAQAWRGGLAGMKSHHPGYILAHACLMVDVDFKWATEIINTFYKMSDSTYRVNVETCLDVLQLIPGLQGVSAKDATKWVLDEWLNFLPKHFSSIGTNAKVVADES